MNRRRDAKLYKVVSSTLKLERLSVMPLAPIAPFSVYLPARRRSPHPVAHPPRLRIVHHQDLALAPGRRLRLNTESLPEHRIQQTSVAIFACSTCATVNPFPAFAPGCRTQIGPSLILVRLVYDFVCAVHMVTRVTFVMHWMSFCLVAHSNLLSLIGLGQRHVWTRCCVLCVEVSDRRVEPVLNRSSTPSYSLVVLPMDDRLFNLERDRICV